METAIESHSFRLVLVDETANYHEQPAGLGRIFGVYLYAVERVVHCCELTGSRELFYVGWHTENWPFSHGDSVDDVQVWEAAQDWLDEANCDNPEVMYMHCSSAGNLTGQDWGSYDGDYEEALEEAIENYRCNPAY